MERTFSTHQVDAVDFLSGLQDESVDLIITDPAYESLEKHRSKTSRLKDWFDIFPNKRFEELLSQAYRVLKPNSHLYFYCDQTTMFSVKPIAESVGFKFWKPLVWDKISIGMGYHYRARYEFILFFEKGKRKLKDLSVPDILSVKRVYRGYPTEKPVELAKILIQQSSDEGDLIIDPFMGSGSSGVASLELGRRFMGADISERAITLSDERLSALLGDPFLEHQA